MRVTDINEWKKERSGTQKREGDWSSSSTLIKTPKARWKGQHLRPHRCQKKWPQQPWGLHWGLTAPNAHETCVQPPDSSRHYKPRSPAGTPAAVNCRQREKEKSEKRLLMQVDLRNTMLKSVQRHRVMLNLTLAN